MEGHEKATPIATIAITAKPPKGYLSPFFDFMQPSSRILLFLQSIEAYIRIEISRFSSL